MKSALELFARGVGQSHDRQDAERRERSPCGPTEHADTYSTRAHARADRHKEYCDTAERRILTEPLKNYTQKVDEIWAVKDKIRAENDRKNEEESLKKETQLQRL